MMLFYVTMWSGRADNCYLEANSKGDILQFFSILSDCKVLSIKKVVWSKKHQVGTQSGALPPFQGDTKTLSKALCKTNKYTNIIEFRFIRDDVSRELLEDCIKRYLLLNGEPIQNIISLVEQD